MTRLSKFLFLTFFLIASVAISGKAAEDIRQFDNEAMSDYAESVHFDYMNYRLKTASIWDMLKWWLQDLWFEFWNNPVSSRLTVYLFIAVMLGIAIFYVVKIRYGRILARSGNAGQNQMVVSANIQKVDYKGLLAESLENKDFKLAIRYLYLMSLFGLANKEIITIKEWKTPFDYGSEMPVDIASHYSQLSTLFEYAWYGDFSVNRADFDKCRNLSEKIQEGSV